MRIFFNFLWNVLKTISSFLNSCGIDLLCQSYWVGGGLYLLIAFGCEWYTKNTYPIFFGRAGVDLGQIETQYFNGLAGCSKFFQSDLFYIELEDMEWL